MNDKDYLDSMINECLHESQQLNILLAKLNNRVLDLLQKDINSSNMDTLKILFNLSIPYINSCIRTIDMAIMGCQDDEQTQKKLELIKEELLNEYANLKNSERMVLDRIN